MLNAVQGFKIASFRFSSMEGRTVGAVPQSNVSASVAQADAGGVAYSVGELHFHAAPGDDIEDTWRKLKALIVRESRHKQALRQLAAQLA